MNDLARAAVNCNAGLGAPVAIARAATGMYRPQPYGITRSTTGVRSEPRASGTTPGTTGLERNHAHRESRRPKWAHRTTSLRTTPCTTGNPHNAPAYHTGTTGSGTAELARRAFRERNLPQHHQEGNATHAPRTPNELRISRRERAAYESTKCQRSRARSGRAACACWTARA